MANRNTVSQLESFHDIPLCLSVQLGTTTCTLGDLLSLQIGSVLELDKLAGEALEILVNKKQIAKGEVLVINENYGIRMTDIVDPSSA